MRIESILTQSEHSEGAQRYHNAMIALNEVGFRPLDIDEFEETALDIAS